MEISEEIMKKGTDQTMGNNQAFLHFLSNQINNQKMLTSQQSSGGLLSQPERILQTIGGPGIAKRPPSGRQHMVVHSHQDPIFLVQSSAAQHKHQDMRNHSQPPHQSNKM